MSVHQYAAEYYDILPRGHRGTLTIRLTGASTVRVISNGFIRSNNVLPEYYAVQALVYSGQTFSVSTMTIDPATDQGI